MNINKTSIDYAAAVLTAHCQVETALGGQKFVSITEASEAMVRFSNMHIKSLKELIKAVRAMRNAQKIFDLYFEGKSKKDELETIVDMIMHAVELPEDALIRAENRTLHQPTVAKH